jgi:HPt (histidine-containing phosphotransfer) domain-containing protein
VTDPIEALRTLFEERCRADLARLKAAPGEQELVVIVHNLAGSAGSFGFPEISAIAGDLDARLRNGERSSPALLEGLIRALEDTFVR